METASGGETMKRLIFDFETRSTVDLKKAGAFKYSLDPSTKPTCLAFKIRGEPTVYFLDYHAVNRPWKDQSEKLRVMWPRMIDEGYLFAAHNAMFEKSVYTNVLVGRYGWPRIPFRQYRCTAAKAAACALPRSLEGAGEVLKLKTQKDRTGYQAMLATCKPTKQYNAWVKARAEVAAGKRVGVKKQMIAAAPEPPVFIEPWTHPEVFDTLYRYCKIDVRTEELVDLALPDLTPSEQEIWFQNQMLNWRGLRIDIPTVKKITDIMEIESKAKLKDLDTLTMGLITKPGAVKSILEFLQLEGVELPNLRKQTVEDALNGFGLSEDMRELLEIRKALSMASTKKYKSFLDRANADDRVRDILLYHGASTGRDTGTGLQVHNFPRGLLKINKDRPYAAVENVIECDKEMLHLLYGESLGILFSALLRNMIIPSEGCELFVADFSKVEVAVIWWLADNEPGLKVLRSGLDPYRYQAAFNTGKLYIEIGEDSDDRQLGKGQILGCFAADTEVLTNSGWKVITDVDQTDLLWDGEEWVSHQGLIFQGRKHTISFYGVTLTPDHLLLSRQGWISAAAALNADEKSQRSVLGLACLPSSDTGSVSEEALSRSKFSAIVAQVLTRCTTIISSKAKALAVMPVLRRLLTTGRKNTTRTNQKWRTKRTGLACSIDSLLRSLGVIVQTISNSSTTVVEVLRYATSGDEIVVNFLPMYRPSMGGTTLDSKWIGSETKKGMRRGTFVSFLVHRICSIVDRSQKCSAGYTNLKDVFDIVNAGPRSRFVIRTNRGPVIAHNCGFGMGAPKFQKTAWDMFRLKLTLKQSKEAVADYREANPAVPDLWKAYEQAATEVVKKGGEIRAGKCRFLYDKKRMYGGLRILWVELPSGRRLAYADPQIAWRVRQYEVIEIDRKTGQEVLVTKTSSPMETLEFWGVNSKTKKWDLERTWGGTLAENITQATARDLMMPGMVRLEKRGYRGLLMVHDEGISEKAIGTGSVEEFVDILCEVPPWATGMPIAAKGWSGPRYRKG